MNVIVDQRTGLEIARFRTYVEAANYRRDVLRHVRRYAIKGVPA